jgi:hypothetical protein
MEVLAMGDALSRESGDQAHGGRAALADQVMIGKVGRVTGTINPGKLGEVMVPVRGGSEAFHAYAVSGAETIHTGTRVVVVEYYPPRTVVVTPM